MINIEKTGGPAFPLPNRYDEIGQGMTIRDYFAARAMQGMLSNTDEADMRMHERGEFASVMATNAYIFADAMLKAR